MDGYGKRVLVVDDDHHARFLIGALLVRESYNVVPACDGVAALKELSKRHFDVVITDDRMPVMSGREFLKTARVLHPDLRMILVSPEAEDGASDSDAPFACIHKPWDERKLLTLVRSATHRSETSPAPDRRTSSTSRLQSASQRV
jgi:CheY-like chemotaxis protein